jgi:hypothetical protein
VGAATAAARVFGKKRAESTRAESKGRCEHEELKKVPEHTLGHEVAGSLLISKLPTRGEPAPPRHAAARRVMPRWRANHRLA